MCKNRSCHTQQSSAAPEDPLTALRPETDRNLVTLEEAKNKILNEKKSQQNKKGIKIQHKVANYDHGNNDTFSAIATLFQISFLPNLKKNSKKVCDISGLSSD